MSITDFVTALTLLIVAVITVPQMWTNPRLMGEVTCFKLLMTGATGYGLAVVFSQLGLDFTALVMLLATSGTAFLGMVIYQRLT